MKTISLRLCCLLAAFSAFLSAAHAQALRDVLPIDGGLADFSGIGEIAPFDRLGGFGSDLYYDRHRNAYFGLVDAGPSAAGVPYATRIQQFSLTADTTSGQLSDFVLDRTILLKSADGSEHFRGTGPRALSGDGSTLGFSFDPEGLVVGTDGHFYIADEFGPALYEFQPVEVGDVTEARFVKAFNVPSVLLPLDSSGQRNYSARPNSNPSLVSGRQENRGFEGLAISPDGQTLFAVMQGPLFEEGLNGNGRFSRNLRIAQFDVAAGESTGQFIYQLESINTANERLPGIGDDFLANDQGRDIGVSALVALNDHELLVLERDSRGVSAANPINQNNDLSAVAIKRIYSVDLSTGDDASAVSLAGSNELPVGFEPLQKNLLLDLQAELEAAGRWVPERIEGLTVGPQLADGSYAVLAITDNDFSLVVDDDGTRYEVYTDGTLTPVDFPLADKTLLPTEIYSFAMNLPSYIEPVPEPSTLALLSVALIAVTASQRRRR